MLKISGIFLFLICFSITVTAADELSRERQLEIIQHYLLATGHTQILTALSLSTEVPDDVQLPLKCGTPAVTQFVLNYDKFDADLKKILGEMADTRPDSLYNLNESIVSPSGNFRIHYTNSGPNAVPSVDYVNSVAAIYDEVYAFLIDTLSYPPPPSDGDYDPAGDEFDVYLRDLGGIYYGLTHLDDTITNQSATTYQELDNDYDSQEFPAYAGRPLDAVRVTCAHEFFHVVQFGMDYTEGTFSFQGPYWMEMSAVWMEEAKYDHINDYYTYLPYFFEEPYTSIQRFSSEVFFELHPYASVVYPLFLSERFDRDYIREIWSQCVVLGVRSDDFLEAADYVIDSATGGAYSFASTFHEFTVWNYFTGSRAVMAPDGFGYSEADAYEEFMDHGSDSVIAVYNNYEDSVFQDRVSNTPLNPYHNAAFYMRLDEVQTISLDTTYWICADGNFPTCLDSVQVIDPTLGYEELHVDSTFTIGFDLDPDFPYDWGLNIIYQLEDNPDSTIVEMTTLSQGFSDILEFEYSDLQQYRSVAFVVTPSSANRALFWYPNGWYDVGYQISTEHVIIDSTMINLPAAVFA
ncbi:MAG: MXAN_6640 family putative metalloprotease, partial [candidate division Zixibacteria bacterium]